MDELSQVFSNVCTLMSVKGMMKRINDYRLIVNWIILIIAV
jgi:hypothetical protein